MSSFLPISDMKRKVPNSPSAALRNIRRGCTAEHNLRTGKDSHSTHGSITERTHLLHRQDSQDLFPWKYTDSKSKSTDDMKTLSYQTPQVTVLMLATETSVCITASGTERITVSEHSYDNDDFTM